MDIQKFLHENGVEYFKAIDIRISFEKKYGSRLSILADETWVLNHVSDVVNFEIVKISWNDSEYGDFPAWISPVGKVEHIELSDYTGWKQHEWRGKFNYEGEIVKGTFINHFHVDRQNDGTPIENIFWM